MTTACMDKVPVLIVGHTPASHTPDGRTIVVPVAGIFSQFSHGSIFSSAIFYNLVVILPYQKIQYRVKEHHTPHTAPYVVGVISQLDCEWSKVAPSTRRRSYELSVF